MPITQLMYWCANSLPLPADYLYAILENCLDLSTPKHYPSPGSKQYKLMSTQPELCRLREKFNNTKYFLLQFQANRVVCTLKRCSDCPLRQQELSVNNNTNIQKISAEFMRGRDAQLPIKILPVLQCKTYLEDPLDVAEACTSIFAGFSD